MARELRFPDTRRPINQHPRGDAYPGCHQFICCMGEAKESLHLRPDVLIQNGVGLISRYEFQITKVQIALLVDRER